MTFAVEKARMKSPLPWRAVEPVLASPKAARLASRLSCLASSGASVATTMIIEPSLSPGCMALAAGDGSYTRPTGAPVSYDDLLDFHLMLQDDSWFEQLAEHTSDVEQ